MLRRVARGRLWTKAEDVALRRCAKHNREYGILAMETKRTDPRPFPAEKYDAALRRLAEHFGRTYAAVRKRASRLGVLWRPAHITLTRMSILGSYDRAARGPNHGRCSPSGLSHQHGSSDMGVRGGQRLRASIRASMRTLPVRCLPGRAPIALRNQA